MKSLNIKKIAAVGAGLALVAASVSAAVSWSNLADDTAKTMKVNGIVVGANAQPIDSTVANNLALELANLATYTEKETTTEVKTVQECESTGEVEATGDGYRLHVNDVSGNNELSSTNATFSGTKLEGSVSSQNNGSKSETLDGSSKSVTWTESIIINDGDVYYDADKRVQELVTKIASGQLEYKVEYSGSDLNFGVNNSTWVRSNDDYVLVPFLGKWYVLDKVIDGSADEIQLLEDNKSGKFYKVGEEITGLKGRDGKTYKLVVAEGYVNNNTNYVTLNLYDEETGELVDSEDTTDNSGAGTTVTFYNNGDEVLEDNVYVEVIAKSTENSSDVFKAKLRTGSGRVVLRNGACYPDYTETNTSDKCDWESFVRVSSGVLQDYGIKNTSKNSYVSRTDEEKKLLMPGDQILFPNNFAAINFVGMELPQYNSTRAKETTTVKVGVDVENASSNASSTGLYFESNNIGHYVPFYYHLGEVTLTTNGQKDGINFTFDGIDHFMVVQKHSDDDFNYYIGDGTYNSSEDYSSQTFTDIDDGINAATSLEGQDSYEVDYNVAADFEGDTVDLWLVLSTTEDFSNLDNSVTLNFRGSMTDESEVDFNTTNRDKNYYVPQNTDFAGIDGFTETMLDNDKAYYTAVFDVANSYYTARAYIDTETGRLTQESDSDNSLSWAAAVGSVNSTTLAMTAETNGTLKTESGERQRYLTYDGMDTKIIDDQELDVIIPDENAEVEFYVYGPSELGSGEQTCVDVNKEVTEEKEVEKQYEGLPLPVITDAEASAEGKYIVIGGYFVNTLFPESLNEKLQNPGDKVAEVVDNLVVMAGYTGDDTKAIVDDVIAALKEEKAAPAEEASEEEGSEEAAE